MFIKESQNSLFIAFYWKKMHQNFKIHIHINVLRVFVEILYYKKVTIFILTHNLMHIKVINKML
jgi:hypothetical protein